MGDSTYHATHDAIPSENSAKIGVFEVHPLNYGDDVLLSNKDTDAARDNGGKMSDASEVIAVEANSKKSAVMVVGGDDIITREMREDLQNNAIAMGDYTGMK